MLDYQVLTQAIKICHDGGSVKVYYARDGFVECSGLYLFTKEYTPSSDNTFLVAPGILKPRKYKADPSIYSHRLPHISVLCDSLSGSVMTPTGRKKIDQETVVLQVYYSRDGTLEAALVFSSPLSIIFQDLPEPVDGQYTVEVADRYPNPWFR